MKKISLFIIGLLFLFPIAVFAAGDPNVDTVTTTVDGSNINYNGTTINGSTAVVCKLYNSNNTELDTFSTAVEDDKFSGTFVAPSNGDYTVTCANYEGGEKKSATAKVENATTDNTTTNNTNNTNSTSNSNKTSNDKSENPKTLDNIKLFVGIFAVSIVLIAGLIVVKKKINK